MNFELFNYWFELLFPPRMIVMFPVMACFIRSQTESDDAMTARRLGHWLHGIAVASLVAFFVARAILGGHDGTSRSS